MKKFLTFVLYAVILGVMGSVALLRLARGCRQFFP